MGVFIICIDLNKNSKMMVLELRAKRKLRVDNPEMRRNM